MSLPSTWANSTSVHALATSILAGGIRDVSVREPCSRCSTRDTTWQNAVPDNETGAMPFGDTRPNSSSVDRRSPDACLDGYVHDSSESCMPSQNAVKLGTVVREPNVQESDLLCGGPPAESVPDEVQVVNEIRVSMDTSPNNVLSVHFTVTHMHAIKWQRDGEAF